MVWRFAASAAPVANILHRRRSGDASAPKERSVSLSVIEPSRPRET